MEIVWMNLKISQKILLTMYMMGSWKTIKLILSRAFAIFNTPFTPSSHLAFRSRFNHFSIWLLSLILRSTIHSEGKNKVNRGAFFVWYVSDTWMLNGNAYDIMSVMRFWMVCATSVFNDDDLSYNIKIVHSLFGALYVNVWTEQIFMYFFFYFFSSLFNRKMYMQWVIDSLDLNAEIIWIKLHMRIIKIRFNAKWYSDHQYH